MLKLNLFFFNLKNSSDFFGFEHNGFSKGIFKIDFFFKILFINFS